MSFQHALLAQGPANVPLQGRPGIHIESLPVPPDQRSQLQNAIERGNWLQVEALLAELATDDPSSAEILRALGAVHFHNGRYFQAAVAYKKAEHLAPLDELSRFTLATAYIAVDRRHWARPELEKLAEDNPRSAVYPYWLAGIYYDYQWFGEAVGELEKAIEVDPEFAPAYDRLGQCLEGMGKLDEALANYQQAMTLNETQGARSPWPAFHMGSLLHDLGRLEEAAQGFGKALTEAPNLAEAHYELGIVLNKSGKRDAARQSLSKSIELDPSNPKPHYALAEVYRRQGAKEKALEELRKFRELSRGR